MAALCLGGCGRLLGPKATLGPGAIVRGRALYNEVISDTNNEQTLALIVHARYGEPSGLLSVSSVTANLRVATTTNAQFGIGPSTSYAGNLVPLSAGVVVEQNPTISYTPLQGERYAKRMLSPLGVDVLVLLASMERAPARLLSILVKEVNGLRNPIYAPPAERAAFQRSIELLDRLQTAGQATWTSSSTEHGARGLLLHDYAANRHVVRELLRSWDLPDALGHGDRDISLPVRLAVGTGREPALNVQTRSVYDLVDVAASAVEVPPEDLAQGFAAPEVDGVPPLQGLLRIQSSAGRPPVDVLVAVRHHGHWFYIASSDGPSKLTFRLLQTLIDMRLAEVVPQSMPTLTIPVAK